MSFVSNNDDTEKVWKYKKNDSIINIVCNSKNGKSKEVNDGITTPIMNLHEYTKENENYLRISYENYMYCMRLKYKIEQLIQKCNLIVSEDYYQWSILKNNFKLTFKIYKITSEVYLTIEFNDESELNLVDKSITSEQLLFFLENNKNIFYETSFFQFQEPVKSELVSNEYSKLFIKRSLQKRICTQMGKEISEMEEQKYKDEIKTFEDDTDLKMLQKKMRKYLKI